jgi:hypothetical protein
MQLLGRVARSFRLAPRGALSAFLHPPRLNGNDVADIEKLAAFYGAPPTARGDARKLLLLSYLPLPYVVKMEVLLARALMARGWSVTALASAGTAALAEGYHRRLLGCEVLRLEDFLDFGRPADLDHQVDRAVDASRQDLKLLKQVTYRNAPIGLHCLATLSAARPEGIVTNDETSLRQLARVMRHSLLLQEAAGRLMDQVQPTLCLGVEKGFVGTCETYYAALERGIDFVQWVGCHEPEAIMMKRYRPDNVRDHPFAISDRNWARLAAQPWHEGYREQVMAEFDRGYKEGNWFRYKGLAADKQFAEKPALQQRLGLDPAKKTAIIYSHILNDANLFYGTDLFSGGYEEWLVETVRAAGQNPAVNWVLKMHPANVFRNATSGYSGEYGELLALRRAFGKEPAFLRVVRPEEKVSPLSFFALTDWGITVRGTVGLELPCLGIPVLTAGTGRYSGKGFTVDCATSEEYLARVKSIQDIPPLDEAQQRLGVRYAYHVFRSRPARYGAVLEDVYRHPVRHARHRDIEFRLPTAQAALADPQTEAIANFLASPGEDDFLDLTFRPGPPDG